ncbi:MAG: hypothetical protein ABSC64_02125 [Candidatus Korobacteraceae bacterium]|jgi:hypothetical protein
MTRLDNYDAFLTLTMEELDNATSGTRFENVPDPLDEYELQNLYEWVAYYAEESIEGINVDGVKICVTNRNDVVIGKDILNHASADYSVANVPGLYEFLLDTKDLWRIQ